MKVGVLAVQGDYEAHASALQRVGANAAFVRTVADMQGIEALILPGGESSTQLQFLQEEKLDSAIKDFSHRGGAILGTCAGAILLAREVHGPDQESLGLADIVIERNGYGRQLASHVTQEPSKLSDRPLEMVFIRAPILESIGAEVEVLAEFEGHPILVREKNILASTFHPELTNDATIHEYFVKMAANGKP